MKNLHGIKAVIAAAAIFFASANADAATLISHYVFNGNVNNQVGGAPDGTIVGGVTFTTGPTDINPFVTNAATFDGGGYVNLTALSPPIGGVGGNLPIGGSVAFWIRTTQSAQGAILGSTNQGGNELIQVAVNAGSATNRLALEVRGFGGTGSNNYITQSSVRNGQWQHIAITWDNSGSQLVSTFYLNGNAQTVTHAPFSAGQIGAFNVWEGPMYLGAMNNRGTDANPVPIRNFVGDLADVRIYSGVLSSDDVQALYTIPEPAGLSLIGMGMGALTIVARRKRAAG